MDNTVIYTSVDSGFYDISGVVGYTSLINRYQKVERNLWVCSYWDPAKNRWLKTGEFNGTKKLLSLVFRSQWNEVIISADEARLRIIT
jgi:hypothetical protein